MQQPVLAQRPLSDVSGNAALSWDAAIRAGDFDGAWSISDAFLAARDPGTRDDATLPYHLRWVWDGRPLAGRQVLVRCYHGLGDTLQFCRYLAPLRARAARVTLEVQPELAPMLAGMADAVHLFDPTRPLPSPGVDIEIMELAHALRLPPDPAPYLQATPSPDGAGRTGVCWQAGGWDTARSMPPGALAALAGFPLVSLQRGPAASALDLPDPLAGSMDIAAVASLVAGLDAVITVDTMIAHLAGALGRPVAVLLKHDADWRWGNGSRSIWYGSARLVRQRVAGDWDGMAGRAMRTLADEGQTGTFVASHVEGLLHPERTSSPPCHVPSASSSSD